MTEPAACVVDLSCTAAPGLSQRITTTPARLCSNLPEIKKERLLEQPSCQKPLFILFSQLHSDADCIDRRSNQKGRLDCSLCCMHAIAIWDIILLLSHKTTADDVIAASGTITPEQAVRRCGRPTITLYPVSPIAHNYQIITIRFRSNDNKHNLSWCSCIR